jgi:hypothetical protein
MRNTAAKKRATREDVDSGYLFGNILAADSADVRSGVTGPMCSEAILEEERQLFTRIRVAVQKPRPACGSLGYLIARRASLVSKRR